MYSLEAKIRNSLVGRDARVVRGPCNNAASPSSGGPDCMVASQRRPIFSSIRNHEGCNTKTMNLKTRTKVVHRHHDGRPRRPPCKPCERSLGAGRPAFHSFFNTFNDQASILSFTLREAFFSFGSWMRSLVGLCWFEYPFITPIKDWLRLPARLYYWFSINKVDFFKLL